MGKKIKRGRRRKKKLIWGPSVKIMRKIKNLQSPRKIWPRKALKEGNNNWERK